MTERFQHIRVKVSDKDDAFDVARAVEHALKANNATPSELEQFRHEVYNSDDVMETARNWVDPY